MTDIAIDKRSKDSLYIVMPAYNEEKNIEEVVRSWYPILADKGDNSRLVIADHGSKDGTHDILKMLVDNGFPKLEILETTNQYHGPKVIALYKHAIANKCDYVFQTDSDGQTDPSEFDDFWKIREQYTGVFGNRTVRGDGKDRAFVEKVVCKLLKIYFGVNIPDANAPFRLMRTDVLKKYIDKLDDDYNLPNIMISTFFCYYKEDYCFKEISFRPRSNGVNSINMKKIIKIGIKALGEFGRFRKDMKSETV
ncbi:MAG: glycosyltransferase family 2 protein [Lachnospiraceae bacterium]|nr:glycosyltransferase family 2 protein [Lachnospiraceae bacterium]